MWKSTGVCFLKLRKVLCSQDLFTPKLCFFPSLPLLFHQLIMVRFEDKSERLDVSPADKSDNKDEKASCPSTDTQQNCPPNWSQLVSISQTN